MKQIAKYSIATFSAALMMALAPTTATAGGSVHIDVPGFSIGVHDDHRYRYKRKYRHRRDHYNDYYRDSHDDYYRERRRARRYERKRRNYDNYYYGGRDRYYDRPRRVEVCPTYGYSRYYLRDRGCYRHKNHFHCSD